MNIYPHRDRLLAVGSLFVIPVRCCCFPTQALAESYTTNIGDGTITCVMTDGTVFGPFPLPAGPQGPAGEVTSQQLSDAIAGTSANCNSVQLLDTSNITDPIQLDQANKINELINALRR